MEKVITYLVVLHITLIIYFGSVWIVRKLKLKYLHPLIIATTLIIIALKLTDTNYEVFRYSTQILHWMLGPAVTALGWVMYSQIKAIRSNIRSILISTMIGSITSLLIIIGFSKLFGFSEVIELSLAPKSVTTPIAIQISNMIGGVEAITVTAVIITGILGAALGPLVYKICRINDPIAQGLGLGVTSHAIGTVRAIEIGVIPGAVGGMAIGIMGIFTAIFAPIIYAFF